MERLLPSAFPAPPVYDHPEFHLRMLSISDARADYEAVMESAERLRRGSPHGWPRTGFTLKENHADLARHQEEFESGIAFAYTMVDPPDQNVLGCLYIRPSHTADADVYMWVRDSHDAALTRKLFDAVDAWLAAEWPFETVVYIRTEYYHPTATSPIERKFR